MYSTYINMCVCVRTSVCMNCGCTFVYVQYSLCTDCGRVHVKWLKSNELLCLTCIAVYIWPLRAL